MAKEGWKAKNNKKLDASYYIKGRKTPIEYSTVANSHWLGLMMKL